MLCAQLPMPVWQKPLTQERPAAQPLSAVQGMFTQPCARAWIGPLRAAAGSQRWWAGQA